MSWEEVGSEVSSKKVAFCKLPTGITNLRVVDKAPFSRWQHWIPIASRSITCLGKGCPVCEIIANAKANGEEPPYASRKTHSINVINRTSGQVEVLEQGNNFFEELRIMHADEGDITSYDIKVRKSGAGLQTKYRITSSEPNELSEEELALVEAGRTDLEEYFAKHTPEQITRMLNGEDPKEIFSSKDKIELS